VGSASPAGGGGGGSRVPRGGNNVRSNVRYRRQCVVVGNQNVRIQSGSVVVLRQIQSTAGKALHEAQVKAPVERGGGSVREEPG